MKRVSSAMDTLIVLLLSMEGDVHMWQYADGRFTRRRPRRPQSPPPPSPLPPPPD